MKPNSYLHYKYEAQTQAFWRPCMIIWALVNEKCYMWTLNDILEDQIMYYVYSYQWGLYLSYVC